MQSKKLQEHLTATTIDDRRKSQKSQQKEQPDSSILSHCFIL